MLDDMGEDYWQNKNIAELAWFLATGEMDGLPKLSASAVLLKLQLAYLNGYADILDFLMRATFEEVGKRTPTTRLTDFSKTSIHSALKGSNEIMSKVNRNALRWLEGRQIRGSKKSSLPLSKWKEIHWKKFLKSKGLADSDISVFKHLQELRDEFRKNYYEPEVQRRKEGLRRDSREATKTAARQMNTKVREHVSAIRNSRRNNKLRSPELNEYLELDFYIKQRRQMGQLNGDIESNEKRLSRVAMKIFHKVEDNRKNAGAKDYYFLLNSDGTTPTEGEIKAKLRNAMVFTLGDS